MIGLSFIFICIMIPIFLVISVKKARNNDGEFVLFILITLVFVAFFLILAVRGYELIVEIANGYTIDNKIAMYEEENASIEASIDAIVKDYMNFEENTYGELKDDENIINLISLYPELKSDTLVQKQIEVYIANNDEIKRLKVEKCDLSKARWLLYFGR